MKYKEWLQEWLKNYVKISAKQRTVSRYTEISNDHLIPSLGEYELQSLSPIILQKYISELLESGNLKTGYGLSSSSVNSIITVIQSSLNVAFNLGYMTERIGDKLKRPKSNEKQVECFSAEEQRIIEKAVLADCRRHMFGIFLCLYSGLRIGELLALEWRDIDFGNCTLSVTKICFDGKDANGVFGRIIDKPKTQSSCRIVPLPKQILPLLKTVKKDSESNLVIAKGESGLLVRTYQRNFAALLKRLNIATRGFHALRHTFATRAIECGIDVKTLSEILGHKNPTVTLNRYAHSLMEHKKDMMNRLGNQLKNVTY